MKTTFNGYTIEIDGSVVTVSRGAVVFAGRLDGGCIVEVTEGDEIPDGLEDVIEQISAELEEIDADVRRMLAEDADYASRRAAKDAQFVREDAFVLQDLQDAQDVQH